MNRTRLKHALKASLIHLIFSLFVAVIAAIWILKFWFPYPLSQTLNGDALLILIVTVDTICGPMLTLIIHNYEKQKKELYRDIAIIVTFQIIALSYGAYKISEGRPLFYALEGDTIRAVRYSDIAEDPHKEDKIQEYSSILGPTLIATKLLKPTDAGYVESIKMAIEGIPPAYRPDRWEKYENQKAALLSKLKDTETLNIEKKENLVLEKIIHEKNLNQKDIGYLPLITDQNSHWVVLINRRNTEIVGFLQADGWPQTKQP